VGNPDVPSIRDVPAVRDVPDVGAEPDQRELDAVVAGCASAHQRLLATLDGLDDASVAEPSLLPGWTVGHVTTHLARQADSVTRVLEAAARGEPAERYPGGPQQRTADIEAGAPRPAREQADDVRRTIWRLESAWASVPAEGWALTGTLMGQPETVSDLPFRRWREVEVHHADLGRAGFSWDDWSEGYVRRDLRRAEMSWAARRPMGLTALPAGALALPPRRRLAWLLGRLRVDGLEAAQPWGW
jgi:maleylpyruvate isomerase